MDRGRTAVPWTAIFTSVLRHREIISQLIKREISARYRGSFLGVVWALAHPLALLSVYTFVFHSVFKARWTHESEATEEFAILLFTGLIMYSLFAECLNRAPTLILSHATYVKKVIFPLEVLPLVTLGSGIFHMSVSLIVLAMFCLASHVPISWTAVWFPVLLAPFCLWILGTSWFLAAAGVFVRDVAQGIGVFTSLALFLSPVLYPRSAVPETYQPLFYLNPLTFMVEQARGVLIAGTTPSWAGLGLYSVCSVAVAWLGLLWFQRTRKGFSDVL